MTPENSSDLLFWPLVIFAAVVAIFVAGFVTIVMVMARRSPGHHPQVAGHQGTNTHDASTTSKPMLINNGEINIGTSRLPRPDRHPEDL